jgi:DNA gyrase subunit A
VQGRGGQGVLTAKLTDDRGGLVGALIVDVGDEVFAITSGGGVIRTRSDEVRPTSRATMGVRLMNLADGDAVVGVSRNTESSVEGDDVDGDEEELDAESVGAEAVDAEVVADELAEPVAGDDLSDELENPDPQGES